MKKMLSVLCMLTLLASLCACSSDTGTSTGGSSEAATSSETATSSEAVAPAASQESASEAASGEETPDASGDPVVNLTWGGTAAAEDLTTQQMEMAARLAEERSGGTIKISVFPASQLGDAVSQMESMISGGQDMFTEACLTYMYSYGVTDLAIETSGLCTTRERLEKFVNSDLFAEYKQQFLDEQGVRTLATDAFRQPIVMATKTPMTTIEEFQGVKLRTVPTDACIAAYAALGFNCTSVAYGEVYLSLQQGVIDGTIAPADAMYTMGFYEVAPYIFNFGISTTNMASWINESKFQSMTPAQQQILIEACEEASEWYTEQAEAMMADYRQKMEEGGATFADPDAALLEEAEKRWREAYIGNEENGAVTPGTYDKVAEIVGK